MIFAVTIVNGLRKRANRACVGCRIAKAKCMTTPKTDDGPEDPCARCAVNGIECSYVPSRRIGRPRRKQFHQFHNVYESCPSSSEHTSTTTSEMQNHTSSSEPEVPRQNSHSSSSNAPFDVPVPFSPVNGSAPLLTAPDTSAGAGPYYIAIINEYKQNVHHYIPVLPSDETQLELTIRNSSPLLMSAVLAIAYPETTLDSDIPVINPTIPDLQAAILMSLTYFGQREFQKALVTLNIASTCLVGLKGDLMEWENQAEAGQLSGGSEDLEKWRVLWWECWETEIFVSTAVGTANAIILGNSTFRPKLPRRLEVRNPVSCLKISHPHLK